MVIWDKSLIVVVALFLFFLGPVYAWGLLYFFRSNFQWHLASIVGICTTVSLTAVMVWYVRGIPLSPEQVVYDLAIVFTSASPSMAFVGYVLDRDRKALRKKLNIMQGWLDRSDIAIHEQRRERAIMMEQIRQLIKDNQRSEQEVFQQVLMLIGLRDEAEKMIRNRN